MRVLYDSCNKAILSSNVEDGKGGSVMVIKFAKLCVEVKQEFLETIIFKEI